MVCGMSHLVIYVTGTRHVHWSEIAATSRPSRSLHPSLGQPLTFYQPGERVMMSSGNLCLLTGILRVEVFIISSLPK